MIPLNESHSPFYLPIILRVVLFLCAALLFARLSELTLIKGTYFRALAEENRIRRVAIDAPRGKIKARGGEILADNIEEKKTVEFDAKEGYKKVDVVENTPADEVLTEWKRSYPLGSVAGHITGYIGEVNQAEVGKADPGCVDKGVRGLGTLVGKFGIEQQYECLLRGTPGEELVEVDIKGEKIRTVGRHAATPGQDVTTTIDYGLQKRVALDMKDSVGAAVVTDGHGQILAFHTSPSFDPAIFTEKEKEKELTQTLTDKRLPLFNRATTGTYHPGSIFKLVTSVAGLEGGEITPAYEYDDTGLIKINDFSYSTWYFTQYGKTEGKINVVRALARSTDTFYYKLGELVGIDELVKWADAFGVGHKTNVDLPAESSGLLATPEWKQRVLGERWFLGNTYHMAIGQGDMLVTPLQANVLTSVVASRGYLCNPHFLLSSHESCHKLPISEATLTTVTEGMKGACATGGTAYPFFGFEPVVACKTGTAETGEKDITHAWFTVFAPAVNPEIVVTVLVEKGGEGSKVAAPIAKAILQYWFHER